MISRHDQETRDLHDTMYAMELRFTERETKAQQEFEGLVDELKNKVQPFVNPFNYPSIFTCIISIHLSIHSL